MADTISLKELVDSLSVSVGDVALSLQTIKGLIAERDELRSRLTEETEHSEAKAAIIEAQALQIASLHAKIAQLTAELKAADYSDYVREQYPI